MTSHAAQSSFDPSACASGVMKRAAIVALLARRAIRLTAVARVSPDAPATSVLTAAEVASIDRLARREQTSATLADALEGLAAIGGAGDAARFLARPFAVARGLSLIADLQIARRLRAAKYRDWR